MPLKSRLIRLLRWSEKYTKTDMVYLASGGFWFGSSSLWGTFISFGLSILFAAYVSKETYGIYRYVLSMAGIAMAFSLTGMNPAITRAVSKGFEGIFARSFLVQAKWALLQCAILLSVAIYYFYKGNDLYGLTFSVIAFLSPLGSISNTFVAFLSGKKEFKQASLWSIQGSVFSAVAMVVAILFAPNVFILVVTYYSFSTLVNFYFTWRTFKKYQPSTQYNSADISYGKHLSFANAFSIAALQLDNILVYHLLGPVELALYNFAILVPDRIRTLLGSVSSIALPKLATSVHKTNFDIVIGHSVRITLVGTLLAICYAVIAYPFFAIFFPAYLDIAHISALYGLSLLAILGFYSISFLHASGDKNAFYRFSITSAIIRIVLLGVGIFYFGLIGALISRILILYIQSLLPYVSIYRMSSSRDSIQKQE